ncbi:MAG TPA: glucose-1-phosphate adenylyltransferase, partial [Chromatiales bacterium]|nr:glucose-1-phosphate adenylyltransferase [Chromatiales bacterium]
SLLFSNVVVNACALVQDSVILPNVTVGAGARVRKAVVDKGCVIPPGMVIGEDPVEDKKRFEVSPGGVVLVTPEMLHQPLHHVR